MSDKEALIKITAQDNTSKGINSAEKNIDGLKKTTEELGKAVVAGFATAQITAFGESLFTAFSDGESALMRFNNTMENSIGVTDEIKQKLLDASKSAIQFGHDDEGVAESLGLMYQRLGDVNTVLDMHQLALNISAQYNKSYAESSQLVTAVLNGRTMAVKALNMEVEAGASPLEVIKKLSENTWGASEKSLNTAGVAIKRYRESMDNLKQSLGEALAKAVLPLLDGISSLVRAYENLSDTTKSVISWVTSFIIITATVAGVIYTVTSAIKVLTMAFYALSASNPFGWIVLAITALITLLPSIINFFGGTSKEIKDTAGATGDLTSGLAKVKDGAYATGAALVKLQDDAKKTKDDINNLYKGIKETVNTYLNDQAKLDQDIGTLIVEQQTKVADLTKQLAEEKRKAFGEQDQIRISELQTALGKETDALTNAKDLELQYATQVVEAKRRASLTEFERRVEDINKEKALVKARFLEKIQEQMDELKQLQKHLADMNKEIKKSADFEIAQNNAIADSYKQLNTLRSGTIINQTTPMFSKSSGITLPTGNTGSSNSLMTMPIKIKDGVVDPSGRVVSVQPDDYIIATRNPSSLGGGGVVVNVYGDVSGDELVNKVSEALMFALRKDTKFSV